MLILGQDKETLVILDNVRYIDVRQDKFGAKTCDIVANWQDDLLWLGTYQKPKRCKEILLEIMKKAEVGNRVYYMPEE